MIERLVLEALVTLARTSKSSESFFPHASGVLVGFWTPGMMPGFDGCIPDREIWNGVNYPCSLSGPIEGRIKDIAVPVISPTDLLVEVHAAIENPLDVRTAMER
jgi:hypothetical protein